MLFHQNHHIIDKIYEFSELQSIAVVNVSVCHVERLRSILLVRKFLHVFWHSNCFCIVYALLLHCHGPVYMHGSPLGLDLAPGDGAYEYIELWHMNSFVYEPAHTVVYIQHMYIV